MTITHYEIPNNTTGFKAHFYKCGRFVQVFINCSTNSSGTVGVDQPLFEIPDALIPAQEPLIIHEIPQPNIDWARFFIKKTDNKYYLYVSAQQIKKSSWHLGSSLIYITKD